MIDTDLRRIQILDWLLDYQPEQAGHMAEISKLIGDEENLSPTEQDVWRGVMWGLRDDGLIMLADSMGLNWGLLLTARGRRDAEQRRARRADPGRRRIAARDGVLAWLDAQPGRRAPSVEPFIESPHAYFEGARLELEDAQEAVGFLYRMGLITGHDLDQAFVWPQLTDFGIECLDHFGGSVTEYVRRNDGARTTNTVNIGGSVMGSNFTIDSGDVQQNIRSGIAGDELASVLRAIVEAVPVLGLSPSDESDLRDVVRQADAELAKDTPDEGWLKGLLTRTAGFLGKTAQTAIGPVLSAYLRQLAAKHGIDLGN